MPFFGVPIRNGLPIGLGSVAGFGVQQFDPSQLFEGGTVAGAWYDPSDLTTMFTTAAGTTPVAMPGQGAAVPVGLMLDKSQGLVLGSELTTGILNSSTNWTLDAAGSVTGGALVINTPVITASIQIYVPPVAGTFVAGKFYQITFNVTRTQGIIVVAIGSAPPYNSGNITASGTYSLILPCAGGTPNRISFTSGASAVNNFVGSIDNISVRELPGNHAISFNNTTARPELRARVNLLTYSEEFDNGAWTKTGFLAFGSGSVANTTATLDPLGGNTADLLVEDTANSLHSAQSSSVSGAASTTYTLSRYVKAASGSRWFMLALSESTANQVAFGHFQPSTDTVGVIGTSGAQWTSVSFTRTDVGNGWYRLVLTATLTSAATITDQSRFKATDDGPSTYTGDGTSGMYWWGADLRPANIGANVPAYQRIADANTYDTSGFPLYLRFDGIDDSMYTPANLNLSGTDKVSVFAGVRKLSDAAIGGVAEFSADANSNSGTFWLFTPTGGGQNDFGFRSRGTAATFPLAKKTAVPAPVTAVVTGLGDIPGDVTTLRYDGSLAQTVTTDQGTGNYGTYPLYVGSRANSSLWLNGQLYSLIIAGSAVSAGNISATEQWVAGKTGIQI